MSPGNLSRLENGEHGPPADEVIAKLAAILDVDVAELYKLAEPTRTRREYAEWATALAPRLHAELGAPADGISPGLRAAMIELPDGRAPLSRTSSRVRRSSRC